MRVTQITGLGGYHKTHMLRNIESFWNLCGAAQKLYREISWWLVYKHQRAPACTREQDLGEEPRPQQQASASQQQELTHLSAFHSSTDWGGRVGKAKALYSICGAGWALLFSWVKEPHQGETSTFPTTGTQHNHLKAHLTTHSLPRTELWHNSFTAPNPNLILCSKKKKKRQQRRI